MKNTVTVIYTGRHGVVAVPCPDGREETVAWGDEFKTTAEHAEALLEQSDNWKPAGRKPAGKQAAPAADEQEA